MYNILSIGRANMSVMPCFYMFGEPLIWSFLSISLHWHSSFIAFLFFRVVSPFLFIKGSSNFFIVGFFSNLSTAWWFFWHFLCLLLFFFFHLCNVEFLLQDFKFHHAIMISSTILFLHTSLLWRSFRFFFGRAFLTSLFINTHFSLFFSCRAFFPSHFINDFYDSFWL